MNDKHHMPQYLDEPFKLILWTIDELIALFLPSFLLMFFLSSPITGLIVGGLCLFGLKYLKGEQGHYFIFNLMYWYFPSIIKFRKIPHSHIREWIG